MNRKPKDIDRDEDEEPEEIDLKYIIKNKPKTAIVRDFLRANICSIENDDDLIFEN